MPHRISCSEKQAGHHKKILTKFTLFVKKNFWLFVLWLLSATLAFSAGFIAGGHIISRPALRVEKDLILDLKTHLSETENASQYSSDQAFVASSRGKYYYPVDCSLANGLKEENKIYFRTREEAESRGYIYNTRCD